MSNNSNMDNRIPILMLHPSSADAYSLFNPNDWEDDSKLVIQSCAAQYSLLNFVATQISEICSKKIELCQSSYNELVSQWRIDGAIHLVEVPAMHQAIHSFLSGIKTYLDLLVQLLFTEGIINSRVQFSKKGDVVGGRLLNALERNSVADKKIIASKVVVLINHDKNIWIDEAIRARDALTHFKKGMWQVLFCLDIYEDSGSLCLREINAPTIDGVSCEVYAEGARTKISEFTNSFLKLIKDARSQERD